MARAGTKCAKVANWISLDLPSHLCPFCVNYVYPPVTKKIVSFSSETDNSYSGFRISMTRFLVFLSHLSLVDVSREWAVHELAPRGESCPVAKVAGGRVGALQHVTVLALVQGNAAVAGAGDLKI